MHDNGATGEYYLPGLFTPLSQFPVAAVSTIAADPAGPSSLPGAGVGRLRLHLPPDAAWGSVYARWTRQNKANRTGRYRFFLAHDLDAALLREAVVEVTASDTRGNVGRVRFGPDRTLLATRAHEEP